MPLTNLLRLLAGMSMLVGIYVLALTIEGAVFEVFDLVMDVDGFAESDWAGPVQMIPDVAYLIVGMLIVGVFIYVIVGPIQRTRVEHEERQVRRGP